jgi:ketosteroid isomerase-like protein
MSQANVEVVQRVHELGPRDLEDGRGRDLFDPDIEWFPASQSLLAANGYYGLAGVRSFFGDLLSTWDEYQVEPEEFLDLGDQVVVVLHIRARSGRGIDVEETWSGLYTLRDGKVIRFQGFTDRNGALAAADRQE